MIQKPISVRNDVQEESILKLTMIRIVQFLILILFATLTFGCNQQDNVAPQCTNNAPIAQQQPTTVQELRTHFAQNFRSQKNPTAQQSLDQQMKFYQQEVQNNPGDVNLLNKLAYLNIRKVRKTVDFSYNRAAEKLLDQSLAIDPENYEASLFKSLVYMSQHQFPQARDLVMKAIALNSYGSGAYGILGDAYYELGSYEKAAETYDKMGDLGPGGPYYARVAAFRALQGYPEEAIELMKDAFKASDPADAEDHAWYLTQLGNMSFDSGKAKDAEAYFSKSLTIDPSSYNALAGLAKVKFAKGDAEEAIKLYQKAMDIVPMPEFAASLGDIYAAQNRMEEAAKQYELVEYIGLLSELNQEIYNRQIAMFYADHNMKLEEALKLVQNEIQVRKDVYGYDALAWCLYKNGKIHEAVPAMHKALQMKTKDAKLFYHAGMIYAAANKKPQAVLFLKKALDLQPRFHPLYSDKVRSMLNQLT